MWKIAKELVYIMIERKERSFIVILVREIEQ
jgi:hypothetical protein